MKLLLPFINIHRSKEIIHHKKRAFRGFMLKNIKNNLVI